MANPISTTGMTSLESQILSLCLSLQNLEAAQGTTTIPAPNRVTLSPDFEANTIAINLVLPINATVNSGQIVITAVPYLP